MRGPVLALLLAACSAAAPASARPAGWRAQAALREEQELGRALHDRLGRLLGFYGERRVVAYVERVGRRIARAAGTGHDLRFFVVDDPAVNAFAAPGARIYVTRGMLAELWSEGELAAVLAHEVAHIERRHALREGVWEEQRELAWTGADSVRFYERSRDNEREADHLALELLDRAGYDARWMSAALERLDASERARSGSDAECGWSDSHPATRARVARAAHGAAARPRRRHADGHLAAIDGMTFGDNPRRGFVAGGSYVLPDLGLAFDLPAGWRAEASSAALWAASADRTEVVIVSRAYRDPDASTRQRLQRPRRERVAGYDSVWGELELDAERAGRVGVILAGPELLLVIAAGPSAAQGRLQTLTRRFRRADAADRGRLRVRRLALVRAPGAGAAAGRWLKLIR